MFRYAIAQFPAVAGAMAAALTQAGAALTAATAAAAAFGGARS
ncbi:hypothetical protein [Streptacidiphilus anmyonensis]|nr:hypothetical protein [Streptacidiphilus anmyonensis]